MSSAIKLDWINWNVGGKTIFAAACAAIFSMLLKWVSVGPLSQNGLSQGAVLLLGLWVYPVLMLLKNKPINQIAGLACSILSVLFTLGFITSKSVEMFGKTVNASGSGAWLFLLASIALIIGVLKYEPAGAKPVLEPEFEPEQD